MVLLTKPSTIDSKLAFVNVFTKCFGPEESAVKYGKFISTLLADDNSTFAFSDDSLTLCNAMGSLLTSIPVSNLNSEIIQSIIISSKLSPPKWVSPFVDNTSKTPPPISKIDTSKVPPPKS